MACFIVNQILKAMLAYHPHTIALRLSHRYSQLHGTRSFNLYVRSDRKQKTTSCANIASGVSILRFLYLLNLAGLSQTSVFRLLNCNQKFQ